MKTKNQQKNKYDENFHPAEYNETKYVEEGEKLVKKTQLRNYREIFSRQWNSIQ